VSRLSRRVWRQLGIWPSVLCTAGLLAGCRTTGSGVVQEHTPAQRAAIAAGLEERLLQTRPQQPIFLARPRLSPVDQPVVVAFINTLPSGRLVESGNPTYWLEVRSKMTVYFKDHKILAYEIAIRRADTGAVVSQSTQSSNCMDSEALYTNPIRCSLLRPMLLRLTLEGL